LFYEAQTAFSKSLYIDAGVRHDNHSIFGGKTTYKVAPAYLIDSTGTKLRGSVSTGFNLNSAVAGLKMAHLLKITLAFEFSVLTLTVPGLRLRKIQNPSCF
jgi:hypothetical protein